MPVNRRQFLAAGAAASVANGLVAFAAEPAAKAPPLAREIGITTGSFSRHLATRPTPGKMYMLDLPKRMREELDMRVIDLMTATLRPLDDDFIDKFRAAADKAGCILTNLKMNLEDVDLCSTDPEVLKQTLKRFKETIDIAHRFGVRWVRPTPGGKRPDMQMYAAAYRELIEYAAPKGIQVLIENNGWMKEDPDAIPKVIRAVDRNLAAAPDTGNWANNEIRYAGLAKAFPLAVTCDFKAFQFGPDGEHPMYDLERCFRIGWDAGFRGPWCLEHFDETLDGLFRGFARLRDMLRGWMAA